MIKKCNKYIGYSVTDSGEVYTNRKKIRLLGMKGGVKIVIDDNYKRKLKPFKTPKGYLTVSVSFNGKSRPIGIHQLVADAFIGECPEGNQVRHLDDDPINNQPTNLRYGTIYDNAQDRLLRSGYSKGEYHHNSKLTQEQAIEIRNKRKEGMKIKVLSKLYAVSISTIESIVYHKSYKTL